MGCSLGVYMRQSQLSPFPVPILTMRDGAQALSLHGEGPGVLDISTPPQTRYFRSRALSQGGFQDSRGAVVG